MFSNFINSLLLALLVSKTVLCQTPRGGSTAKLIVVDFDKCGGSYGRPSKDVFYRSIYVNLNQWTCPSGICSSDHYTSHYGNSVAVNWVGADWAGKTLDTTDTACSTCYCHERGKWVALDAQKDVRHMKPEELLLDISFYGGYGQMYIPFLHPQDSELPDGQYYMLHLYNDDWVWNDGVMAPAKLNGVKLYKFPSCSAGKEYYNGQMRRLNITSALNGLGASFTSQVKDSYIYSRSASFIEMTIKNSKEIAVANSYTTEEFCGFEEDSSRPWSELVEVMSVIWDYGTVILGLL